MRITKDPNKPDVFETNMMTANIGCNRCPNCGETRDHFKCLANGESGGISGGIYRSWTEGFFRIKCMRADVYKCYTCGTEWESEPYQYC